MSERVKQVLTVSGVLFVIYALSRFVAWATRKAHHHLGWNEAAGYFMFAASPWSWGVVVFRGSAASRPAPRCPARSSRWPSVRRRRADRPVRRRRLPRLDGAASSSTGCDLQGAGMLGGRSA